MKTAIYVEDGFIQLVMTPESEFERNALSTFREKRLEAKLFSGSFYDCRGGWVRQSPHSQMFTGSEADDKSLIVAVRETEENA